MDTSAIPGMAVPQVIVPLRRLDRPALAALTFARSISADVTALFAIDDVVEAERFRRRWSERCDDIPLVLRGGSIVDVLLRYLDEREHADPERPLTVVVSDVVARHAWSISYIRPRWG